MAATKTWTGAVDGDLNVAGNWSPSGVPVTTDTLQFISGSVSVVTNADHFDLVNAMTIVVGPEYAGKLGTSAAPLKFQNTAVLLFNGRECPNANFDFNSATLITIEGTGKLPNALDLIAGTYQSLVVKQADGLTITGGTVDAGRFVGAGSPMTDIVCAIASGVTLTNLWIKAGKITCDAAIGNLYLHGGEFTHQGTTTQDITLLEIREAGAVFKLNAPGMTLSTAKCFAGLLDATEGGDVKTISAGECWPGGIINLQNGLDNITATLTNYGGKILGGTNVTITQTLSSAG